MTVQLRPHRESYSLRFPFELFIDRTELLASCRGNRLHCWLELSTLVRMLAAAFGAVADWKIRDLDQAARTLQDHPQLPGLTISVLPGVFGPPRVVYECIEPALPCIVPGYDAVIEHLRRCGDPAWLDT